MSAAVTTAIPVSAKPAILGGEPVKKDGWPKWPIGMPEAEDLIQKVIHSRDWTRVRGPYVAEFEKQFAKLLGVRYALVVCGGTDALHCMMHAVDIAPGDEVLVSPYTFHTGACMPLMNYALPIFVDIDRESFQMDPAKIEEKITEHTRAILVCHWGGQAADMDRIMEIAKKHDLAVCEDSYQGTLGQWRGRQIGSIGDVGCLAHHHSEILPCGEGSSIITNSETIMRKCYAWGDFGRDVKLDSHKPVGGTWPHLGRNLKVTEMQGAVLLAGLKYLEKNAQHRVDNAVYLRSLLQEIPGITPQKEYEGQTRGAYLWAMFRYEKSHFNGLPLDKFVSAVRAEGLPVSRGMTRPLTKEPYIEKMLNDPHMQYVFSRKRLDFWRESLDCPVSELVTAEENFGLHGRQLQGKKEDMKALAKAILKVRKHSKEILNS